MHCTQAITTHSTKNAKYLSDMWSSIGNSLCVIWSIFILCAYKRNAAKKCPMFPVFYNTCHYWFTELLTQTPTDIHYRYSLRTHTLFQLVFVSCGAYACPHVTCVCTSDIMFVSVAVSMLPCISGHTYQFLTRHVEHMFRIVWLCGVLPVSCRCFCVCQDAHHKNQNDRFLCLSRCFFVIPWWSNSRCCCCCRITIIDSLISLINLFWLSA